jgi:hypothetical protein
MMVKTTSVMYGRRGIYITDHPTFIGETIVTIQTRNTGVTTDCYPCVVFGEPKKIYGAGTADNFITAIRPCVYGFPLAVSMCFKMGLPSLGLRAPQLNINLAKHRPSSLPITVVIRLLFQMAQTQSHSQMTHLPSERYFLRL